MAGIRSRRHVTVTAKVSGVASVYTLNKTSGDMNIDNILPNWREVIAVLYQGKHGELIEGDDMMPAGAIPIYDEQLWTDSGGSTATIYDLLNFSGAFASGVSSDPGGVVPTLEYLRFSIANPGGGSPAVITMPNVHLTVGYGVAKEGSIFTVNWTSYWTDANPITVT